VPDSGTNVPRFARIYDYWLGGKDNFAASPASRGYEHTLPTQHAIANEAPMTAQLNDKASGQEFPCPAAGSPQGPAKPTAAGTLVPRRHRDHKDYSCRNCT
jgi:hypothetical protein